MVKVAICGIDGAGKTALIEKLFAHYQTIGISVDKAKVDFPCKEICKTAELLKENKIVRIGIAFDFVNYYHRFTSSSQLVLCDRFDVCYRVLNRVDKIGENLINQLDKLYSTIEDADLYILLDIPVDLAAKRLTLRGDRAENESDDVLRSMQHYYNNELAKKKNSVVIDASQSIEVVFGAAKEFIDKLIR